MTARVQIALRLPAELAAVADQRAQRLGVPRHEVLVGAIRGHLTGDDLEEAVETVVQELALRGREDLAVAVAVATDDRAPEERAASAARLLQVLKKG